MTGSYDVIVVGGGPAGASCALFLARMGVLVLLLEKEILPRDKPCGGAVPRVVLSNLGIEKPPDGYQELYRVLYTFRGGRPREVELPEPQAYSVLRAEFDHDLVLRARGAGAQVLEGQRVTGVRETRDEVEVETSEGTKFRTQYLVACDGAGSSVARYAGLRGKANLRDLATSSVLSVFVPAPFLESHRHRVHIDFGFIGNGYAGILPKEDRLSICIYSLGVQTRRRMEDATRRFMETAKVGGREDRFKMRCFPIFRRGVPLCTSRIFLVGDAAGLADPLTGEGIRHAVGSAGIAANVIAGLLQGGHHKPCEYRERIYREIGKELVLAGKFARVAYTFPSIAYEGFANVPLEAAQVLNGSLSYGVLLERLKKKVWRTLGQKIE